MAVANGSLSLDGTTISEIEAKSMIWPLDLAHYYIQDGIVPEEDPEAAAAAAKIKTTFRPH